MIDRNMITDFSGQLKNSIDTNKKESQNYIVQYENILALTDYNILSLIGCFYQAKNMSFRELDSDILKDITVEKLINREEYDLWDYIKKLHMDKGISEQTIDKLIDTCKKDFQRYIINTTDAELIYLECPELRGLDIIRLMHNEKAAKSITILVNKNMVEKCVNEVGNYLSVLFKESLNIPVYIDLYEESNMSNHIMKLVGNSKVKDYIIMLDNKKVYEELIDAGIYDVTFLFPDIKRASPFIEDTVKAANTFGIIEFLAYKETPKIRS